MCNSSVAKKVERWDDTTSGSISGSKYAGGSSETASWESHDERMWRVCAACSWSLPVVRAIRKTSQTSFHMFHFRNSRHRKSAAGCVGHSFSSKWCFFGDYFSAIIYLGVHLLRPEILEKMLLAPLLRRRRRMMEQFDQHTHHTSRFMHPVSRTSREPLNARDDAYPLPQAQPQGCQRCRHTIGRRRRPRQ